MATITRHPSIQVLLIHHPSISRSPHPSPLLSSPSPLLPPSLRRLPRRSMATLRPATSAFASTPNSLLLLRQSPSPSLLHLRRSSAYSAPRCVFSGGGAGAGAGGGGVADEFVYTRRSGGGGPQRHFSALADLLLRIEPLDTQVVAQGVSAHAKDSMKRTISAMLGLLPSDQFHISVRLFKRPLHQLLLSSIITGYTLWNAEYRISLMRNYDISPDTANTQHTNSPTDSPSTHATESNPQPTAPPQHSTNSAPAHTHHTLPHLSLPAQLFIQNMESELQALQTELDAHKCESMYLEHNEDDSNDLLGYLRSLDPPMVYELSKPSFSEVEGIVHQLALSVHRKFFLNEARSADEADEIGVHTSRDHLAKLLFWCMLMGHHLRGLEYRLQLSWVF